MVEALLSISFGLAAGLRHAMEPDHLAAVSTLVANKKSPRDTFRYAASWGVGHAAMLLVVGAILFSLKVSMPVRLGVAFELAVGVMLVVLGVRSMLAARHSDEERADGRGDSDSKKRPLFVGTMHGLAGSGALVALAMTKASTLASGLGFLAVYGVGAMVGMGALAGLAGVPLAKVARHRWGARALLLITGVLCVATGLACLPMLRSLS